MCRRAPQLQGFQRDQSAMLPQRFDRMPHDPTPPVLSILMPVRNEGGSLSIMLKVLPPLIGTSYEILVIYDDLQDTSIPSGESAQAENPKVRMVHNRLG